MLSFISNFVLIFCAMYYFIKLLNLSFGKKNGVYCVVFLLTMSGFSVVLESNFPHSSLLVIVILSIPFFMYCMNVALDIVIPVTIISYGISYIWFAWSALVTAMISTVIIGIKDVNYIILQMVAGGITLLMMHVPFCIKRLKKGMPFLKNERNNTKGVIISLAVLISGTILKGNNNNIVYIVIVIFIYVCTVFVYIYWRRGINRTYLEKLHERNMLDLNSLISEQQQRIKKLEEENGRLSSIVHKDNKLIPAMEYAVKEYLSDSKEGLEVRINKGKQLLTELEKITGERKNIIHFQDEQCQQLPCTKIIRIDSLLQYMQQKAREQNITLNAIVSCKLQYFVREVITEDDFCTLLADLMDNALIATRYNNQQQVLINFSIVSNAYSVNIFDSGIPFEKEVLVKLGVKQITTHADDSGSGIGLMTIYGLVAKYRASIIINEFTLGTGQFTKEISVVFNGLNQFILKTARDDEEIAYLKKRTNLQIIRK